MDCDILNLDSVPFFVKQEWIKAGKKYPKDNTPYEVQWARADQLKVPETHLKHLPTQNLPVIKFLEHILPCQSAEIITTKACAWFSPDAPITDIKVLLDRPIPPTAFLLDLGREFGQAWFDGAESIIDHRFNNSTERLPLWIITFWTRLSKTIANQNTWRKSCQWLDNEEKKTRDIQTVDAIQAVWQTLSSLAWNSHLTYLRGTVTSAHLAKLLGTAWLDDNHINMMMEELSNEVASDPGLADKVIIATLSFAQQVLNIKGTYTRKDIPLLCRYEKHIKEYNTEELYFPIHINTNHWIAGLIDFKNHTINFGDSLDDTFVPPKKLLRSLQKWLGSVSKQKFSCGGNSIEHGSQIDGHSCGIILGNTVEHAINATPIWEHRRAIIERLRWFQRLASGVIVEETRPQTISPNLSKATEDMLTENSELSISIALGDHNFPDLTRFALDSDNESGNDSFPGAPALEPYTVARPRLSLSDMLNPASELESMPDETAWRGEMGDVTDVDLASNSGASEDIVTDTDPSSGVIDISSSREFMDVRNKPRERPVSTTKQPTPRSLFWLKDKASGHDKGREDTIGRIQKEQIETVDGNGSKRPRVVSDTDSSDESESGGRQRRGKVPKSGGTSRSAKASRARREKLRQGELKIEEKLLAKWKQKLRADDPHVEFHPTNVRSVRHSTCGRSVLMKEVCDATRWRTHLKECAASGSTKKPSGGMHTLLKMGFGTVKVAIGSKHVEKKSTNTANKTHHTCPCPGIAEGNDSRVPAYLRRTGVSGGGSRSVKAIAGEVYNKLFSMLGKRAKRDVLDRQQHEHKWRNDHQNLRVFAVACKRTVVVVVAPHNVQVLGVHDVPGPLPCDECVQVLSSKAFKTALQKPPPDEKNYIYTNHRFRSPLLGQIYARTIGLKELIETPDAKNTPCIRYAQGVLTGKYDNKVFHGLMEAVVTKYDRKERGVGLQNFRYAPAWDEMCHILKIHSPRAYESLSAHLPARSMRNFRTKESRQPRFPMEICDRTFQLVVEHLKALHHTGPVGLSCDDTKLFSSFRLYWDKESGAYFLIGGVDGPYRVADPDSVRQVISEERLRKATKVRLWCLTVPSPNVTPIIMAVMPIANDLSAEILLALLEKILDGLIDRGIQVISYACDGTEVERSVQRIFIEKAEKIDYKIKNPHHGCPDTQITIVRYRGQAMCMIQDSKHALKTFRNNLFSGARLLTFGNFTATYSNIREMAMEDGTPLYKRDVDKLDRQDDNAAARLFSSHVLQYLADHHPDYVGEIVYLFVFGELIDAYQNRTILHVERLKLVLCARYFLNAWATFLDNAGYKRSQYFLSREAVDIARIIIEGYIALLVIHRDHVHESFPLLPWLHSTEACEHAFGEARRIVKDFTLLDLIYMIPKLRIKIREGVLRAQGSDPKARAAGYNHTYVDNTGVDVTILSLFPSDEEIQEVAEQAAQEADSLIALLGLTPSQLHHIQGRSTTALPSIMSWFQAPDEEADSDSDSLASNDDRETERLSEAQELQNLLDHEEDKTLSRTRKQEERLLNLTCAAMAVVADEAMKVQFMADVDEEAEQEIIAEEYQELQNIVHNLPPVQVQDEAAQPFGHGVLTFESLDFKALIDRRCTHQTCQADKGVRTRQSRGDRNDEQKRPTLLGSIIRQFHEALKEAQDDRATGTGYERSARWTTNRAPAPGARDGEIDGTVVPTLASGNSANAAATAAAVVKQVAARRRNAFTKAGVPNLREVLDGLVSVLSPLKLGTYGFILTEHGVRIGRVTALYSKTGGKNGKHAAITDASNLSAVSYLAVQVFEYMHGRQFREQPDATAVFRTKQFALLASNAFLCLLSSMPKTLPTGIELGQQDAQRFRQLSSGEKEFKEAMRLSRKRRHISRLEDDELE